MTSRPARQVRFISARRETLGRDRCAIQVELICESASYRARAEGRCGGVEELRCAAEAAVQSLRELGHTVSLDEVKETDVLGYSSVAVQVTARRDEETRQLVGFCVSGDDPIKAAVLAVLNGTNRFLDIG